MYSVRDWCMADLRVRGRSCLVRCTMRLWLLVSSPAIDPGVSLSSRQSLCLGHAVRNFHAHLRYQNQPAGASAYRDLLNEPMIQKALAQMSLRAKVGK